MLLQLTSIPLAVVRLLEILQASLQLSCPGPFFRFVRLLQLQDVLAQQPGKVVDQVRLPDLQGLVPGLYLQAGLLAKLKSGDPEEGYNPKKTKMCLAWGDPKRSRRSYYPERGVGRD